MTEFNKHVAVGETATVAKYIAGVEYEDLPVEVVVKTKQHILDSLAAMVSGNRLEAGKVIVEFARQHPGKPESTVIGSNFKTSCITACLVNGTLSHADETDDVHYVSIVHAGSASVPAALAVAEREKADGKAFITAVALAYDIVCRVSRALDSRLMRKKNHCSQGISSGFGAAAAASCLLGLREDQVRSALGLVGDQASGIYAFLHEPRHMAKAFQLGAAARNGVTAAFLAQVGFQGPPAIFEGPQNIFEAFSSGTPNLSELTRDLGRDYDVMGASIKKYPAGGPVQAPLEGLFQIMQEQGLRVEDIQEITVGAAQPSVWLVGNRPIEDISVDLLVASGAYYGKLGWEESHSEAKLKHPKVQELKKRIKFVADAKLEKTYPRIRAASVQVITKDGTCHSVVIEHVPGMPQQPFSQAQVAEKFLSLTSPVLGTKKARGVVEVVGSLEELSDVGKLGNLLRI